MHNSGLPDREKLIEFAATVNGCQGQITAGLCDLPSDCPYVIYGLYGIAI